MKARTSIFVAVLALVLAGAATLSVETRPAEGGISPALQRKLQRLPQWGTVIYITAHPDDESAGTLTYLARGLHQRVVLLCLTRGEGGQNQTGSELGEELGWVRTRELQRAVAGYG
ncbi:MAG: PIG-L family deacetylase, partial [Woeseiaceae bacterium]